MNALQSGMLFGLLVTISAQPAYAQGLTAVRPLPGYVCMDLNLSAAQIRDDTVQVPVRAVPSAAAPQVGIAGATVIAISPIRVVNGFAEILFPNSDHVWIAANMIRPYRSASNPNAKCTPSLMSNGKPGFG